MPAPQAATAGREDPRGAARRELEAAEARAGPDSLEAAHARIVLADLEFQHDLIRARALYVRSLAALQREAADTPLIAALLQRLTRIDYLLGDLPNAHSRGREALRVSAQAFGAQHPQVALALLSLAEIAHAADLDAHAAELADAVEALLASFPGDDPVAALMIASPLGALEAKLGRVERAEQLLERGLAAAEQTRGPDSLAAAARLNDLASVDARRGRVEIARARAERAVEILRREAGADSIPYALGLDTLGVVNRLAGRAGEAREQLESALVIVARAFGRDSPVLLEILEHHREGLAALGAAEAEAALAERIAALRARRDARLAALDEPALETRAVRADATLRSAAFGYTLDLGGTGWRAWDRIAAFMPLAELGALHAEGGGFAVLPVSYFDSAPDPELALPSLLALVQTDAPAGPPPLRVDGHVGVEVTTSRLRDGAEYRYRARALSGPHAGYVLLAWLTRERAEADPSALEIVERVRLDATRAPRLDAQHLSVAERARHAAFFNELGLRSAQRARYTDAIDFLARAAAAAPDDPVIFENLIRIQMAAGDSAEAREALRVGVERFPDHPRLRAYRAQAAAQSGDPAAALDDYARAFALGVEDEALFAGWIEALWRLERREEALARLEARIAASGSTRLRLLHALLLRGGGEPDRAVTELRALAAEYPEDPGVLAELAGALIEAGRAEEALALCDAALERLGPVADLYAARANAEVALGRLQEATESFERAVALDPASQARPAAPAAAAAPVRFDAPIDPVPVPAALALLDALPAAAGLDAYGAAYSFWIESIDFAPGVTLRRTAHFVARIGDARGVERFTTLRIPFDPLFERIFVNDLIVRDAQGKTVAQGDPDEYYVLHAPDEGQATSARALNVPVPGLQAGGSIEMRVTREDLQPPQHFVYTDHSFSRSIPVARSALVVHGQVDAIEARASADVEQRAASDAIAWWIDAPTPMFWEPLMPRGGPALPEVRLGARGESWETLARAYHEELAPLLAPIPDVEALADRSVAALPVAQRGARVRALAALTRDQLSYTAIEFGMRARIPPPLPLTLARRYGDCKDHALLLYHLLRRAGIRAHLALVSLARRVDADLPALDQFDHMIVYCEGCGAGFIDATDKDFASDTGIPRGLAGAQALILDPDRPRLVRIPEDDLASHQLSVERTVRVATDGAAHVSENLVLEGSVGAAIRGALRALEPSEWKNAFQQRLAGDLPASRLQSLEVEHMETPERALEVSLEYDVQDLFARTTRSLVGRLPAPWERALVAIPRAEPRRAAFAFASPLRISTHVRVIAPERYGFRADAARRQAGRRSVHWQATVIPGKLPDANALQVEPLLLHFEFDRPAGEYAAQDYAHVYEDSTAAIRLLDAALELAPFAE
ncbi:MAG: tetratricopeptide repeat protein [Myxococcales bacterium]|nr:tetratricopeptide repeat protein [Myxococcales bacterium]